MSVTIKLSNGTQQTVEVPDLNITVAAFKELVSSPISIPPSEQRVVLRGKVLKDTDVLSSFGLKYGQAVHIVRGKASANTENTTPTQPATSEQRAPSSVNTQNPTEANNPYAALTGSAFTPSAPGGTNLSMSSSPYGGGGGGGGFGGSSQFDMSAQLMQNPAFSQLVQETMRNPQLMQQIMQMQMQMSPMGQTGNDLMGMRGMQQLQDSPAMMQQAMQMMGNQEFMGRMLELMNANAQGASSSSSSGQSNERQNPPFWPGMFQQMPNMTPPQPSGDPRVLYREQLQQLRDMGFPNEEANLAALQFSQGNVDFAIERLLNA